MSLFLVLLAAGDGKRLKSKIPKPYNIINNKTLLEHSLDSFVTFKQIKKIIIVHNKRHKKYINKLKLKKILKVVGGKNRQESTFNALKKIKNMNCKNVIIHDAARPNPSKEIIKNIILNLRKKHSVIPVININDATKIINNNQIVANLDRKSLKLAQTPQGFSFNKLYKKHFENKNQKFDDDSAMFINDAEKIKTIRGNKNNIKITNKEDLINFSKIKKSNIYYGIGFDIHRLVKNSELYLGGIKIPFNFGLKGHSDGDPVLHALIDALLGACKLGDIGSLFSEKNKKFKNIRSTILLKKSIEIVKEKNFKINNIDINIITQKPKIKKYKNRMIKMISKLCEINHAQINIKGKTTEKLGLIGKQKAIASEAIVSVTKYV